MNLKMFSPSGGMTYHARALWNRKRWLPFCEYVESWLMDWAQSPRVQNLENLVLVGPNAGYTLPKSFVGRFRRVVVVEPDPVAYALFEARFQCRAIWIRHDYFGLGAKNPQPDGVRDLFSAHPQAAILFCNMIGQLPVLLREKKHVDVEAYMRRLGEVLSSAKSQTWASYHDRYSRRLKRPNEYVDHLTGLVFETFTNKKEFPWRITGGEEHQIEFVTT